MKKLYTLLLVVIACLFAVDAYGQETEKECKETTEQVWENGVLVSEIKTVTCVEKPKEFDPKHDFKDHVKERVVDLVFIGAIAEILK